jgi:hypothetical protein
MTRAVTKAYLNRFADPVIAGAPGRPGDRNSFDINIIRGGKGVQAVSRMNRNGPASCPGRLHTGRARVRRARTHTAASTDNTFHFGAVNMSLGTVALVAVAVVGGYFLLRK